MATPFRNLLIADSRGVGIGDPSSYDYLAMPVGNSFGTAYTFAPTATLSGGVGTGAAAAADVYRNADGSPNSNQAAMVGIPNRGRGFTNGSALPTITVTGGGGTGASYTSIFGGGWLVPLETALVNAGLLATLVPGAKSGARISAMYPGSPIPGAEWAQARVALNATTNFVVSLDIGINDAIAGETLSAWQSELTAFCTYWLAQGAAGIIIDKPYGIISTYANAAAINALVSSYGSAVTAVAASNPTKIFVGASLYPLMDQVSGYFTNDFIHPNRAGNTALAAAKASAHAPVLASLFGATPATLAAIDSLVLSAQPTHAVYVLEGPLTLIYRSTSYIVPTGVSVNVPMSIYDLLRLDGFLA